MRRVRLALLFLLVALAVGPPGCKGKGDVYIKDVGGEGEATADGAGEVVPPDGVADWSKDVPGEADAGEVEAVSDVLQDAAGDEGAGDHDQPPEVWKPAPCKSHEDCEPEGLCVELVPNSDSFGCAPFCLEECPLDWECKSVYIEGPDPVSLCLPPIETSCKPCANDWECLFPGSICIKGSGALGFCGKLCDPEEPDCPEGMACDQALGPDGKLLAYQCQPPAGSCCVAGKLKSCDDKNPCSEDYCDPSVGCKHKNVDGPCEGEAPCTEYKCVNGACMGIPVAIDATLDGIDDDCDGQTDEDWALGLKLRAGTLSPAAGTCTGAGMTLRGTLSTPPAAAVSSGGDFKAVPILNHAAAQQP